jgi:hypothetical protein
MSMLGRGPLLLTSLLVLGCTTGTDPARLLTVSGTVTQAGAPVAVTVTLSAGNFSASREFNDGVYALTLAGGGVPESACGTARVRAALFASDGKTIVDEESRELGECGEHTVNFDFP